MKNLNKDETIKNFLKLLDGLKEDYFIFTNIPEVGLGVLKARRNNENDMVFDWAKSFLKDDEAFKIVIQFLISIIACMIDNNRYDRIDELKELINMAYENKEEKLN